jgi:hypothetical protein
LSSFNLKNVALAWVLVKPAWLKNTLKSKRLCNLDL